MFVVAWLARVVFAKVMLPVLGFLVGASLLILGLQAIPYVLGGIVGFVLLRWLLSRSTAVARRVSGESRHDAAANVVAVMSRMEQLAEEFAAEATPYTEHVFRTTATAEYARRVAAEMPVPDRPDFDAALNAFDYPELVRLVLFKVHYWPHRTDSPNAEFELSMPNGLIKGQAFSWLATHAQGPTRARWSQTAESWGRRLTRSNDVDIPWTPGMREKADEYQARLDELVDRFAELRRLEPGRERRSRRLRQMGAPMLPGA